MARYAATARIDRVQPHLARHGPPRPWRAGEVLDAPAPEAMDLTRPAFERWERIRERWAQTTFYLFDPDSWR